MCYVKPEEMLKLFVHNCTINCTLGKVCWMLSGETNIQRKKITFHTKFWARGHAEVYLHDTILPDFTIIRSKK